MYAVEKYLDILLFIFRKTEKYLDILLFIFRTTEKNI